MVKVKVIVAGISEGFETLVNNWLASHKSSDIVNIQFRHDGNHIAYITYRDGS